jgi:hypothetical protein
VLEKDCVGVAVKVGVTVKVGVYVCVFVGVFDDMVLV